MKTKYFMSPFNFIEYCLVLNEKQLKKVCKQIKVKPYEFCEMTSAGRVDFIGYPNGRKIAVVRIVQDDKYSLAEIIGLIAHEAVHIKQEVMSDIGENTPSSEFEAYFTQQIVTNLVSDYLDKTQKGNP